MKVILDAMGGDNAPREMVLGALDALKAGDIDVVLVGRGEELLKVLAEEGMDTLPPRLEISDASEVVEMEDDPARAVRQKKDSSMARGLAMLNEGYGAAFLSAGSTGALLSGATLVSKRIRGIRRGALMSVMPSVTGEKWVLMDCGANLECTPEYLLQFAYMGSYYMEMIFGVAKPRVGILNIGTERTKGTNLQRETYTLLEQAAAEGRLNFVGNVEARDVMNGTADVVVCDGYSGNILLKGIEGMGVTMLHLIKDLFLKNTKNKLAALMVKKDVSAIKSLFDYKSIGGAPFLGISKPVYKIHGSAKRETVAAAIAEAATYAESGVIERITRDVEFMKVQSDE